MNRPSKMGAWLCWILTVGCCLGTLALGYNVVAALAISGLATLLGGRAGGPGNGWLLVALAPAALAVIGNVWMLWGGSSRVPGVSPWWLVPSLAIAVATFGFGAYVCVDIWH